MSTRGDRPEFVEPHPRARRLLAAALLAAVVSALLLAAGWQPLIAHLRALPACELLSWIRALLLGAAALSAVAAVWLAALGWGVVRDGRIPRPGAWVLRRTRLIRSSAVRWAGGSLIALATGMLGAVVGMLTKLPAALAQLSDAARCAGA